MTYRDENEALRARVARLEEDNRELRAKLEPPPPPPPPPPEATPSASPATHATLRRIAVALGVAALGFGLLYAGCASFQAIVWRGETTFDCPINGDVTIRNKTIRVTDGPAIKFDVNCNMRLVRCDIRGRQGLQLSVNNTVTLEDTHVEGTESAIALGTNSVVDATGSTIVGPITPLDASVRGVTELPIERVTKDRHAVSPLENAARGQELARLGPDATLRSIDALYVDARGLVDLDAADYKGSVEYAYELPVHEAVAEPPAVRPGLLPPPRAEPTRRIVKVVRLDAKGMRVTVGARDWQAPRESVSSPRCSMAQLWAAARRAGVPDNAVARVTFDSAGAGLWGFAVDGTAVALDVDNGTCEARAPQ